MKIDKNGLWFKLHKLAGTKSYWTLRERGQVSLCPYFWEGLSVILMCILTTVLTAVFLWVVFSILVFLTGAYTGWWGFNGMMDVAIPITIVGTFFAAVSSPFWGLPVFPNWVKKPVSKLFKKTVPETPKSVNLVKEYYKAHKSKFCPMITLEDNSNE